MITRYFLIYYDNILNSNLKELPWPWIEVYHSPKDNSSGYMCPWGDIMVSLLSIHLITS